MKYLLVAFFVLAAFTVNAQQLSTPINISNQAGTERPPIMHIAGDGTIYLTWIRPDVNGGYIYIAYSTNNGVTFSEPKQVTHNTKISADFQRGGEFVVDTKNNIHLVWVESRINKQQDIWYSRSTDRGETWTEAVMITDDTVGAQDYLSIGCDSSDRIYVSFLDTREKKQGISTTEQLYITTSSDGGNTWAPNKRILFYPNGIGGTCECCKQDIAVSPEGHIYVTYRSNINNQRDMHVVRSMDGGLTFEPPILIQTSPWIVAACPTSGPNSCLDKNENLHVVWRDNRQSVGVPKVYYTRLDKGSSDTPGNFVVSGDALQPNWPDVDATGDGTNVAITYQTFDKGLQYVIISDNLSEPMYMVPDITESQKVLSQIAFGANGTRYIAWSDDRNDNGDIFFTRDTAPLPSLSVKTVDGTNKLDIPTVVKVGEKIMFPSTSNSTSALLSDVSGREVANFQGSTITIPNLPLGIYFIKVMSSNTVKFGKLLIVK